VPDCPEKLTGGCLCGAVRYETTMKPFKVSYCHCESCRKATAAPVLAILAESSPFAQRARFRELLAEFGDLELVELPGGHHLHMEGAQADIAARMLRFFGVRH